MTSTLRENQMDLSNLFVVKTPKEETSVLIRLGRVTHYALSAIGWIWIAAAVYYTIEYGRLPATLSDEVVFLLIGGVFIMIGRGIRYIFGGE
jgi:hypothetical protein